MVVPKRDPWLSLGGSEGTLVYRTLDMTLERWERVERHDFLDDREGKSQDGGSVPESNQSRENRMAEVSCGWFSPKTQNRQLISCVQFCGEECDSFVKEFEVFTYCLLSKQLKWAEIDSEENKKLFKSWNIISTLCDSTANIYTAATDTLFNQKMLENYIEKAEERKYLWRGRAGSERFKFRSPASVVQKTTDNLWNLEINKWLQRCVL